MFISNYKYALIALTSVCEFIESPRQARVKLIGLLSMTIIFSILFSVSVKADELHLVLNGKSIHMQKNSETKYNENNYGIGMQYDFNQFDRNWISYVNAGGFSDSLGNPSYYIGGGLSYRMKINRFIPGMHIDTGFTGFFMTRQDTNGNEPFPGVLPMLSFGNANTSLNVTYIPQINEHTSELWFFQLKIKMINI